MGEGLYEGGPTVMTVGRLYSDMYGVQIPQQIQNINMHTQNQTTLNV